MKKRYRRLRRRGMGEKKAQGVNLGRIQAIRDILYELKESAVLGDIVRRGEVGE